MKLVKELGIISLALVMSGCTVLGFATDMALFSASEDNQTPGDPRHGKSTELIFTKEGLKQDAKVVKKNYEGRNSIIKLFHSLGVNTSMDITAA